jgi:hypothetical protein
MDFQLRFTDKEITAWPGLSLLKRMLDHMGFDSALAASGLPQPKSNRGYRPEQLIVQFMLGVWCGANRFEHGEVTRHDTVLRRLFGFACTALPAQEVWRTYRGRADCENRIKELKCDFAVGSFCLNNFFATEACLNMVMMAYNLMSLFRQGALKSSVIESCGKDVQHTLQTLRLKLFAKAGYITTEGRKDMLKLAIAMRQREWFEGLWNQSKSFELPVRFVPCFQPMKIF